MRFVWAVAAFVLAALLIGAGIAQRTVFEGPTTVSQSIDVAGTAPYVLIDGDVLGMHPGAQTVHIEGSGPVFASYGRSTDAIAWLARSEYVQVGLADGAVTSNVIAAAADDTTTSSGASEAALSPQGSDLWLDEFDGTGTLDETLQLPAGMSLLVASDGTDAAPGTVTVTWPIRNSTPWAGPLILLGCILLVAGLVLYLLAVRHARRSRGPRRKGTPLPVTEPIDVAGADKGVISATPTRRRLTGGKRTLVAVPAVAVSALLFTGCTADAWPQLAPSATPSPSATVVAPKDQESPVVTEAQAERIVGRIAEDVAKADEARDATAAAERLDGTALAARVTNYTLLTAIPEQQPFPAIPSGKLQVILPEANDEWPRTFFAVAAPLGSDDASTVMSITQQDPWSPYKLTYLAELTSDADLNLAPAYVGAIAIPKDSPFLAIAPDNLAGAYADVLTKGDASEFAALFDSADDAFRTQVDKSRADRLAAFNATGAQTGTMTFSAQAGTTEPVALATLDSGAIVAVTVDDLDTVAPTNADAVIKVDQSPMLKTLAGVDQSSTGFVTTYGNQLFFFVPSQSSKERIQLLGYSSNILSAKVAG